MKVGFTGSSKVYMSMAQLMQLTLVLKWLMDAGCASAAADMEQPFPPEFHDGGEAHSDVQARTIAGHVGFKCVLHPPKSHTAAHLLARDKDIANICDVLIAAPRTDKEELRSGTWATVRYARAAGKPVIMLSRCEGRML